MRRLDQLEIAITASGAALLTPVVREFAWGPVEESLLFADGRVFGRLAASGWDLRPWLAAASSDLTILSLWPMIDLPTGLEPPSPADFAGALCQVLTASDIWIVWCESDLDQRPVLESMMDAGDVSWRVRQCLEGPSNTDLIAYSHSAARRVPPGRMRA